MSTHHRIGQFVQSTGVGGETYRAYIPPPLPPNPPLNMAQLYPLLDQANKALGQLDAMSMILPDSDLFLYMYVRKEAVLSSQIEGTQSSLSDLLSFEFGESPRAPIDDVTEVSCYVAALNYGLGRLRDLPLSLRLLREMHDRLMTNNRGGNKQPGEFRTSQNWIGGTRPGNAHFVPPPAAHLMECLDSFEKFLHDDAIQLPALVRAALAHLQFETIHPFLDGNGRLGRLLITLMLYVDGILRSPTLYLSLYLKTNRDEYYHLLQSVRTTGNWEDWIIFFLEGVIETANQASKAAHAIVQLFDNDRKVIETSRRSTNSVLKIHTLMKKQPFLTAKRITEEIGVSLPTAVRNLSVLEHLKIAQEITGQERKKIYVYKSYLNLLNEGTEPI